MEVQWRHVAARHGGSGDEVFRVCSEFNGDYSGVGGETPLAGKMARSSFFTANCGGV